ncbi:hypothetical protein SAMN05421813_11026 [Daejeonella rubra]|uniref:Lipocalin-like domain-containing protein n=1 Tax=Daejeonella rubra TaxID=990371 RepID=A0A1G9SF25_9SPHI|nr:hypothetical protein [Daejeonella rubra]SDM34002.1 hypothetical protein SAMN05421813_11026 [Daejeonella rubra]
MKFTSFILFIFIFLCSSCDREIEPKDLYGRWNYIAVENFNPPDSLTRNELIEQAPAIVFSTGNKLVIEWGGKQLSHGTYKMDGKMIRYTESLEGGKKREFPFLIKELGEDELVFETMEQNYTRVKAKKR